MPFKSCDLLTDEGFGCEAFGAQLAVDIKGGAPCCAPTVKHQAFQLMNTEEDYPAHSFLFGFVRTAERCHYGHEIGEMADTSAQCTVDVKGDLIYFNISHPC